MGFSEKGSSALDDGFRVGEKGRKVSSLLSWADCGTINMFLLKGSVLAEAESKEVGIKK